MSFSDFRKSILKVKNKRNHKIKNSLGVRDIFKICRKEKWYDSNLSVTESTFYSIIRAINKLMSEELLKGRDVKLPQKMGQLEVRKYDTYVKLMDGKLRTNRKIDWQATLQLWYEDEEAKENKVLIKSEDKEVFKIFYNKMIANYNNKTLYQFKPNRELSVAIKHAGKSDKIDAYKIGL